jgi:hypothetical protein
MAPSHIPSDKELLAGLLEMTQLLYVQNILLRGLLRRSGLAGWKSKLDSEKDSVVAILAREDFQRTYALAVQDAQKWHEFLEKFPTSITIH